MSRTAHAVEWSQAAPPGETRTQQQAANMHGISQAAISAALSRTRRKACQVRAEREACASVADAHNVPHVARAILKRGGAP